MQLSILSYMDDSNNVDRQNKTYLLSPNFPSIMFEWRAVWFGMEWPGGYFSINSCGRQKSNNMRIPKKFLHICWHTDLYMSVYAILSLHLYCNAQMSSPFGI